MRTIVELEGAHCSIRFGPIPPPGHGVFGSGLTVEVARNPNSVLRFERGQSLMNTASRQGARPLGPAAVNAKRVLRYVGKDPSAVDPYWDFEHLPGELYDADALRLWRLRVFVSKPARARLLITHTEDTPEGAQEEPTQRRLAADEHILRYNGGPEREAPSYDKLSDSLVEVTPPSTTFVVNLTKLDPGAFVVRTSVLGAQQQEREMRFRIIRRPFYTYPGLPPGKAPVVRSHTGLQQMTRGDRPIQVIGYRWDIERREWLPGDYQKVETQRVHAEAVLGEGISRWNIGGGAGAQARHEEPENLWHDYAMRAGVGLEVPQLIGSRLCERSGSNS